MKLELKLISNDLIMLFSKIRETSAEFLKTLLLCHTDTDNVSIQVSGCWFDEHELMEFRTLARKIEFLVAIEVSNTY